MSSEKQILFLFTKQFPYGEMEQYLVPETKLLSAAFEKIIVVPCEFFADPHGSKQRELPENFEVLNINAELHGFSGPSHKYDLLSILVSEFLHEVDKWRFLSEFKRYYSVLRYQSKLADYFGKYLESWSEASVYLYSYWLHNPVIMLGLLKKKGIIKNFISRAHSIDLYHNDWPLAYAPGIKVLPFQYFKTKMCSAVYSISKTGEEYLKKKYRRMKNKFFTSYLGIEDLDVGRYDENEIFTMVSCSGMSANKRVSDIALFFSKLKFPARWVHFGTGEELKSVTEIVSKLPDHLKAELPGFTENSRVLEFYKNNSVNLFVNLSRVEGIPVSLMEASAFGIPLLATDVFGNREIVNEKTGFLVKENFSMEELVKLVTDFAGNKKKQLELRQGARAFCLQTFEAGKNFRDFFNEIQKWRN